MRLSMQATVLAALCFAFLFGVSRADDAKPEYTIKQVMKMAHKDGLLKKVTGGDGSEADAEKLLALYKAMAENEPPKGSQADWNKKTGALVEAAQEVVDGKDGSLAALKKAANCAACHKAHKPS